MNRHLALISQRMRTANTGAGSGIPPFVVRFRCDIFLALLAFVADAQAGRPSKVFVSGRLATFDAPSSDRVRTGLIMEVQSSDDILLEATSNLD